VGRAALDEGDATAGGITDLIGIPLSTESAAGGFDRNGIGQRGIRIGHGDVLRLFVSLVADCYQVMPAANEQATLYLIPKRRCRAGESSRGMRLALAMNHDVVTRHLLEILRAQ
jgi:hypothetical protein